MFDVMCALRRQQDTRELSVWLLHCFFGATTPVDGTDAITAPGLAAQLPLAISRAADIACYDAVNWLRRSGSELLAEPDNGCVSAAERNQANATRFYLDLLT